MRMGCLHLRLCVSQSFWVLLLTFALIHPFGTGLATEFKGQSYDKAYGDHWYDGFAELSSYHLTVGRYGEKREGTAVAIFVTEDFSASQRVKADAGKGKESDKVPVMKLNLMKDFPTGVYDYNTMLSSFIATKEFLGHPAGSPLKISFSSQEWCGHVYHQILPHDSWLQSESHSYFDGEADRSAREDYPKNSVFADTLLLWARGLSAPSLSPGQSLKAPLYSRLIDGRLRHFKPQFEEATFEVSSELSSVKAHSASFRARKKTVTTESGRRYEFWVEDRSPYRVLKWIATGGTGVDETAVFVKSKRMKYWSMNNNDSAERVRDIGLTPRQPLTP